MIKSKCHICGSAELRIFDSREFCNCSVTSDGKIFPKPVKIALCLSCNTVQKNINEEWREDIIAIYGSYDINHQSQGSDPYIFTSKVGPGPRSELLISHIESVVGSLPDTGSLLDFGCGNGNFIKAFGVAKKDWDLYGLENSDRWKHSVSNLVGVKGFFLSESEIVGKKFDIIVLSHVLEHIPYPELFIKRIQDNLNENGYLVIAVPNFRKNPIDIFVYDHCSHFDDESLARLLLRSGVDNFCIDAEFLHKEIIVIINSNATLAISNHELSSKAYGNNTKYSSDSKRILDLYFKISKKLIDKLKKLRKKINCLGLFGSSIVSIWLTGVLGGEVEFYIDEDENRIGKKLCGKPIYAAIDIPQRSHVFIPLDHIISRQIISRIYKKGSDFSYLKNNNTSLSNKTKKKR